MRKFKILRALARRAERTAILCHHNADPDAVCSAFSLGRLLKRMKRKIRVEMAAPEGVSRASQQVLKHIPARFTLNPKIEEADVIFIVDTNTLQQLEEWKFRIKRFKKPIIVIDHHAPHPKMAYLSSLIISNERASSTCEIIYDIYRDFRVKPSKLEALAMFLGMVYDTRHFALATSKAIKVAAELVDCGVKAEEAIPILQLTMAESERVARLKAAQRLEFKRIKDWIVAISRVGSYQASAARALVMLGSHVAIVGGEKGGELRISLRSTRDFYKKTGVHLGKDVAKPMGKYVKGMGGGHALSAGLNGVGNLELTLNQCLKMLAEALASSKGGR